MLKDVTFINVPVAVERIFDDREAGCFHSHGDEVSLRYSRFDYLF